MKYEKWKERLIHFVLQLSLQKIIRRNKRAFDLAQIESNLEEEEEHRIRWELLRIADPIGLQDKICLDKCNENLRLGLDMVKAHIAFGVINVPSVEDESDLKLFCRLDDEHSRCLSNCGFMIQYNMNDYICKDHYQEMIYLLPCYRHVISMLRRECGAKRCGTYTNNDNTTIDNANRCRLLLCNVECTTNVLIRHCTNEYGQKAARFIRNYTSQQVSFWMEGLIKELNDTMRNPMITIPPLCSRLICHNSQCLL
ncbi:unnamed protein product [Cercopithifilaria johnstoni]|uniref:Uncharacterized protein n=1 Tax=Cercopithifilaria johnstoni TaxID=2874296 RepID=A0A8J2Q0Q5_9BILA|nr:unnamed protein product [Cercopithifilaria johnstoni]